MTLTDLKITPRHRSMFMLLGGLIFFLVISLEVVFPLRVDIANNDNALLQAESQLAALQTFAGQNQDYESLLKIQGLKVAEAKKQLPDLVTAPELVAEYSQLAEANGVRLLTLNLPTETKKIKTYFALPIKMSLGGDYFKLIAFLQQVETGTRFVKLEGADFTADDKDGSLKMDASFVVYALKGTTQVLTQEQKATRNDYKAAVEAKAAREAAVREAKK
ncbi:MAG: type 4a pilus biogenesis protein PilO [Acidaminococcaceae bacterium]